MASTVRAHVHVCVRAYGPTNLCFRPWSVFLTSQSELTPWSPPITLVRSLLCMAFSTASCFPDLFACYCLSPPTSYKFHLSVPILSQALRTGIRCSIFTECMHEWSSTLLYGLWFIIFMEKNDPWTMKLNFCLWYLVALFYHWGGNTVALVFGAEWTSNHQLTPSQWIHLLFWEEIELVNWWQT